MEYSLHTLNKVADLQSLKLSELIDRLNLIGFEVDEIYNETLPTNKFIDNTRLLIKIPPNREDLLNEKNFLNELSTIFSFDLYNNSKLLKKSYASIIEKKYQETTLCEPILIDSKLIYPFTGKKYEEIKIFSIEIENFENFSCPLWIQNKLTNAGLNFTNTIDDLISLVKLEWGQSINCLKADNKNFKFSLEQLVEPLIYKDEKEQIYNLTPGTIVLKDQENNIKSILGLFNTANDLMSNDSKTLLLECIYYDIHSNDLVLNPLDNKISLRYLRSMGLINFNLSFSRLLTLIELTSKCKIKSRIYSTLLNDDKLEDFKILKLRKDLLKKILNINSINLKIFDTAGLNLINQDDDKLIFSIPIQRNDLVREIDLVEEYSRFIGYKNFNPIYPSKINKYLPLKTKNVNLIKQIMLSNGFQEVLTNPLHDINKQKQNSIVIQNPLNKEFTCLRLSLVDKLIDVFERNLKLRNHNTKFFEIGRTFEKISNNKFKEIDKLSGIFQLGQIKRINEPTSEWFIAKGFIENLLLHFGYKDIKFTQTNINEELLHPTKTVLIKSKQNVLGYFGEVSPKIENIQYSRFATYIFELNLVYLTNKRLKSTIPTFQSLSKSHSIIKDISFLINKNNNFYNLKTAVISASNFIKDVEFFDLYFEQNKQNVFNIGLRLTFQSEYSTFTTEIIEQEINKIKEVLLKSFKAEFK